MTSDTLKNHGHWIETACLRKSSVPFSLLRILRQVFPCVGHGVDIAVRDGWNTNRPGFRPSCATYQLCVVALEKSSRHLASAISPLYTASSHKLCDLFLCVFFEEMCMQILCPLKKLELFVFLSVSYKNSLYILDTTLLSVI